MAGAAWYTFQPLATTSAANINTNFDWMEQQVLPQVGGTARNNLDDLGSATFRWRFLYLNNLILTTHSWGSLSGVFGQGVESNSGQLRVPTSGIRGSTSNTGSGRELSQGTISTPDIRSNALTAMTTTAAGSLATGTTITAVSFTSNGGPILVVAQCTVEVDPNGSGVTDLDVSLDRAGTGLTGGHQLSHQESPGGGPNQLPQFHVFGIEIVDVVAAGTYTYNLRYTINTGSFTSVSLYGITCIELKASS